MPNINRNGEQSIAMSITNISKLTNNIYNISALQKKVNERSHVA
jgi:hypothetical protein